MEKFGRWLGYAAMFLAVALGSFVVWWGALNQDEGWYIYAAQMVRSGLLPYRDFFFTQGPALPFIYSLFTPVWAQGSPLAGIVGARVVTFLIGLGGSIACAYLAALLTTGENVRRRTAALIAFTLLACNIYHVYFTTIPKTYSLGSLFVLLGFLSLVQGVRKKCAALFCVSGFLLALASGTRISLVLILGVVGVSLLLMFKHYRWAFFWFGIGGVIGLALTYGYFAFDDASRTTLLAAQEYHASRGASGLMFAIGSISRLVRGYFALVVVGVMACAMWGAKHYGGQSDGEKSDASTVFLSWVLILSALVVMGLQLAAPFPYDDYQVPVMGLIAAVAAARFASYKGNAFVACALVFLATFSSPLLQEWKAHPQDRFWSRLKEQSEVAKLREMGREINELDPGGKELLTQDLYLAVETGRTVPRGLEMGPFSYFPKWSEERAAAVHVLSRKALRKLLESAPCRIAVMSGYAFAISAPKCDETPFDEQVELFGILKQHYELCDTEKDFGQNATTLLVLCRKEEGKK